MDTLSRLAIFILILHSVPSHDYKLWTKVRAITITHKTGSGRWHGGEKEDFTFKLIGSKNRTAEHVCIADRDRDVVGVCTFNDPAKIGRLKGLSIANAGDNFWAIVDIEVEINGVLRGSWSGYRGVNKFNTAFVGFPRGGDVLGELLMSGPIVQEQYPTCDCWTSKCGYCTNPSCTIKQSLSHTQSGIQVQVLSTIKWRTLNSVVLFDEAGSQLGTFQWSISRIYLTGCVQCRTPKQLRKSVIRGGQTPWKLSIKEGVMAISIKDETVYNYRLMGQCREVYERVRRFAFSELDCSSSFRFVPGEMELGDSVSVECDSASCAT